MPMTSAARRASRASSSVQQPRAPVRYELGLLDSARCTPVTSCPAAAALAAATAESTPPDMAARTRMVVISSQNNGAVGSAGQAAKLPGRPPRPLDDLADHCAKRVDVGLLGRVAERKSQRTARPGVGGPHC